MQIISKDKKIYCQTKVHYDVKTIKQMKKAGYKVKVKDGEKGE